MPKILLAKIMAKIVSRRPSGLRTPVRDQILDYLVNEVECFCGDVPAFDDLTLCVAHYTG